MTSSKIKIEILWSLGDASSSKDEEISSKADSVFSISVW